jgi:phage terminase large subunit-like protein
MQPENKARLAEIVAELRRRDSLWPSVDPNPAQAPFLASDRKFRCFSAGFGSGKTHAGAVESWRVLREYPGVLLLVVAPTYLELRDYTQRMFFDLIGTDADTAETSPLIERWNKTDQHLTLSNGSEVFFRSADKPATLVGSTVGAFWLDEPARCKSIVWRHLIGRLRSKVGPRRGWITGTPEGYNWVWREFAERERADYGLFTGSTYDNSENLPEDYVEAMTDSYTGAFARANIFGEFVAFEGQVYQFSRSKHLTDAAWEPEPDIVYDRTADFGTNNPTAWLWIQEIAGTVYVFDELEVRRQAVHTIATEVKSRWDSLQHGADFGDIAGTQHDSNLESYVSNYARDGIIIRTRSGGRVKAGIEVVTRFLTPPGDTRPRLFVHPRCTRLMAAFETYHWPEDKDGLPMGDEPVKDGTSDHLMDALRYWFVNRHNAEFRRPSSGDAAGFSGARSTPVPTRPGGTADVGIARRTAQEDD